MQTEPLKRKTSKIANRARIIFFSIPIFLTVIILGIGQAISRDIADDNAMRMSRQYVIESAANFQIFMNPHMRLMQQMAYSTAIARWFAYGADEDVRAAAFEAMMGHAVTMPDAYFMFSSYESLRSYDFNTELTIDEFLPWGYLVDGGTGRWFYNTLEAEAPFIINIQRTRPDEYGHFYLYIWSNHRVYYQGQIVGVVTIGSPFADIFNAAFYGFDVYGKRGYIIDQYGAVRMDSAGILETTVAGIPLPPSVPEVENNPALEVAITSHLQRLQDGAFPLGAPSSEAIRLTAGEYRYASISPIVGTNWSVMVLSGTNAIFFDARYMPLMYIAAILVAVVVLVGGILIQRTVLQPIQSAMEKEQRAIKTQQLMYDSVSIPSTLWDINGNLIDCNEAMSDFLGLSEKEDTIKRYYEFTPEYQACGNRTEDICHDELAMIFSTGQSVRKRWLHKIEEEIVPAEVTMTRIPVGDTFVCACYAVDLRPMEAAIAKEREAYKKIQEMLDLSPTMINEWSKDIQLIKTNKRSVEWYRVSNEQEYLDRFAELAPEFQPCGTPTWQKAQEFVTEAFEKGSVAFEWITYTADGELLPIWVKLVRSSDDENAIVYAFTSDLRDIKKLEAQLRENEINERERENKEYIAALFQASPMFIDVWDEDLNLIDCNDKVCDLLGVPTKEEFLNNLTEKYNPHYQPCGTPSKELYMEKFKIGLKEGHVKYNWVHLDVNGNEVPLEVTYVRIYRQGKALMVGYNYDLRDIKKAQAERQRIDVAEESNRAKSAFLARMSHEIRTPITAVMGISEIELHNPHISPQTEDSFIKINNSANSLLGIVNDILDLSKIEAGKMELAREEYDVASLVVDTSSLHLGFAGSKNISFNVSVDENLPTRLVGDALRISQIINNVLSNAFKYTLEGSVDLSFVRLQQDEHDDFITFQISVKDSGLGMTSEQLEDLANEYTRYHEHNYQFIEGTGLGMPIVYNLVKLMGGKIEIGSEVGVGTNVTLLIPQGIASQHSLGKETAQRLELFEEVASKKFNFEPEPMPYGRVLIVDDIDANLYVAKGLMAFYDLNIETCDNGYEAINKIKSGNVYDIVFMDYMMPGISGTEAMQKMRELGYMHPVVALTANAMIGQADEFIKAGFDSFISKPIQTKRLNSILTKFIKDKQPPEIIEAAKAAKTASKGDINSFQSNPALLADLRRDFVKRHSNTFEDICNSINTGDTKTAHRLAHTIKGAAGLLREDVLASAADEIEQVLGAKGNPKSGQLAVLENELNRVLASIGEIQTAPFVNVEYLGNAEALSLLEIIEPLLAKRDVACVGMLDEIRKIPQSERLCSQIEDFDFSGALESFDEIKKYLGGA